MLDATLLENVDTKAKICREEAFGPVAVLSKFSEFNEALASVNDSKFGLQAGVFTRDLYKMFSAWDHLDVGGVVIARNIANRINANLAIVDKRRDKANTSEVMNIIGDVSNRDCLVVDDIVDTAGTLCNAAEALKSAGAKSVSAYISHGVLSGPAIKRISESKLSELVITNSIAASKQIVDSPNIRVLNLASLIAEAIRRISSDNSVSSLFD